MEAAFRRHVMQAWFPRSIDPSGGFLCDFDRAWKPDGAHSRMLEFQARQTRACARLALAFPGDARWAEWAVHGVRYLRQRMWDSREGGWFWLLDPDGTPSAGETKHAHAAAYAVQACALVFQATGDRDALALAAEGFDWYERLARDRDHGGFHSWMRRDGSVILRPGDIPHAFRTSDPLDHDVGLKDVNVHGDWFETLLDLRRVAPSSRVEDLLEEFGRIYVQRITTPAGELHFAFHSDWTPQPGLERFGYGFQAANRMLAARDTLPYLPLAARAEALVMHAARRAWRRDGGFRFAGPAGAPSSLEGARMFVDRRSWWVQFEGLRALALADAGSPSDGRYWRLLQRHWAFVRDRMLDDRFGGVYDTCPGDLRPWQRPPSPRSRAALRKGNVWKDASHETDSLLDCIAALRGRV